MKLRKIKKGNTLSALNECRVGFVLQAYVIVCLLETSFKTTKFERYLYEIHCYVLLLKDSGLIRILFIISN